MHDHACNNMQVALHSQDVIIALNTAHIICNLSVKVLPKCPIWYLKIIMLIRSRRRSDGGKCTATCSGSFAFAWFRHAQEDD